MKLENNNPFTDSELYPITGFLTSSFLDPYLQKFYNPSFHKLENGLDINPIWNKYIEFISGMANNLRDFFEYLNKNKLEHLKDSYDQFSKTYDEELKATYREGLEDISPEVLEEYNKTFEKLNAHIKKQAFLKALADTVKEILWRGIRHYNENSKLSNIFIDNVDIVCLNKEKDLLVLTSSNLTKFETDSIIANNQELFDYEEKLFGVKSDSIFIIYSHLSFNIQHRPFGLMFLDKRLDNPYAKLFVDYFNTEEAIYMRRNGGLWWDSERDDYFDDDDEDDDF